MAEENRHTTYEQEGSDEIKSRGMFDFLSKKEEEKPQEEVLVTEFKKVQVSEEPYEKEKPCEKEEEVKEKKPGLKEKLHRSTSSSSSYNVNFNAENGEHRIEMDPLGNNSLVSQARHQTWQPTVDGLNAGFDGNVANEEHQAGAEITRPQQREIAIRESSFQLDQSQSTQTMDGQDETLKNGMQVAFWATSISASGVTAVWTQFLVNKPNTPGCTFFAKATLLSMGATFMSGLFILILTFIRPKFVANPIIVKILMFGAIGSTTLVVGFGVASYLEKSG